MEDKRGHKDITAFLLSMALILFMFDIALRRLNINLNKFNVAVTKINTSARAFVKPRVNITSSYEVLVNNTIKEEEKPVNVEKPLVEVVKTDNSLDTSFLLKNKRSKK